jgi:FlaA1/EpsC-like NDP-sugar epimerase
MTRFFMTLKEAVKLVLEACVISCGGEVFVTKMPVMRIPDLAQAMIELLAPAYGFVPKKIPIRFMGVRSGEKLYEELLTVEEMDRALETENMFVILPFHQSFYRKIQYSYKGRVERASLHRQYISSMDPPMTVKEIKHFLLGNNILGTPVPAHQKDGLRRQGSRRLRLVNENQAGVL